MTPDRRSILALFSLAFGFRILYAAIVGSNPDFVANAYTYDFLIANKIAAGANWLSEPISPRAPGYQLLLGGLFSVFGVHKWLVIILQAFFGGVIAFLLYRIGEKSLGPTVGLFAAVWFSIYVQEAHYTSIMLRDVTVTMLATFTCYLLIRYAHTVRGALWTALAYAVLLHFDPQFLLFLPVITLYFLFYATRHRLLSVQYAFLFLGAVLVLLVPWTARNYRVYGNPIPVALEAMQYYQPARIAIKPANAPADNGGGFWRNSVEYWRVTRVRDHAVPVGNGPDRVLPAWSFRHNAISLATYGLLLPFFLVGLWASVRNRNRTTLVLSIAVAGMYLIRVFYGGSPHTRLPAEPLIILLAFYGFTHIMRECRSRRARVDTGNSP